MASATDREEIDTRPQMPDTVDEWKTTAREKDVVVMLEGEEQTVFVAHVSTDEFPSGKKWVSNAIDPETGRRSNSFATSEGLIDRWFREAVPNSRVWTFRPENTPLESAVEVAE